MTEARNEIPADWAFLRRPRWLLSHLAVAALIVAMIAAGLWQIARHGERADRNDTIRQRAELPVIDLGEIAAPEADAAVGDDQQFRRVSISGVLQPDDEVTIRNRSFDGSPGLWVLTPLLTDQGWAVAVNRGWIPANVSLEQVRPPDGRVEIVGYVQPSRQAEGFQQADPAEGRLTSLARTDVERFGQQLDYPLSPVVLQLAAPDFDEPPASGDLPFVLSLPPLDAGPHASYAAQWFIFTTIAVIGYPLVLRRVSRGRAESLPDEEDEHSTK